MADGLQRLIEHLPGGRGDWSRLWHAGSRSALRAAAAESLGPLTTEEKAALLDLQRRPRLKSWSLSLSHTQTAGGWLAVPPPARIGFDLEIMARVREEVVLRIGSPEELRAAPDAAMLWVAKESCYKSLPTGEQPPLISAVRILTWKGGGEDLYSFTADVPGRGYACRHEGFVLAAFFTPAVSN